MTLPLMPTGPDDLHLVRPIFYECCIVIVIVIVMFEAVLPNGATDSHVRCIRVDPVVRSELRGPVVFLTCRRGCAHDRNIVLQAGMVTCIFF